MTPPRHTTPPRNPKPTHVPAAKAPDAFPMRINKYLALKGYSTRRGADELIAKRVVTVNGRLAVLGDKVTETDMVEVRKTKSNKPGGKNGTDASEYSYYACYKPAGITVLDTRKGQRGFAEHMPAGTFPIGSLDQNASGLIIFTDDRRIIARLENPNHPHPKEYFVESATPLRANFKAKLEAGISLDNGPVIPCHVSLKGPDACYITVTDAKNRIRQICSLFGAETARLTRTGILNIELRNMKPNNYRRIEGDELALFLKSLGL